MSSINIKNFQPTDSRLWDEYVLVHPGATLYHLSGWKNVIEKTYGHKTHYLIAVKDNSKLETRNSKQSPQDNRLSALDYELVTGILPLFHIKHFIFGNSLISIPFFDLGGILADDEQTEKGLLQEAINIGEKLKVDNIELRHIDSLSCFDSFDSQVSTRNPEPGTRNLFFQTRSHKVRMLLELPESSDVLMKSFKAKLRSQIKKPFKEGLYIKIGGPELLNDFYKVFSINMRDLGSPVHSKKLIQNVFEEFSGKAKIVMVYKDNEPVACSVVVGFKDTLENPWASALREYSRLSSNMLLYWTMLEYAGDNGYIYFDFGRSSPDEGTYKFKQQWGSKPTPLHWQYIYLKGEPPASETSEKAKFEKAIRYWQKLPVSVTKILGPRIRKYIGL